MRTLSKMGNIPFFGMNAFGLIHMMVAVSSLGAPLFGARTEKIIRCIIFWCSLAIAGFTVALGDIIENQNETWLRINCAIKMIIIIVISILVFVKLICWFIWGIAICAKRTEGTKPTGFELLVTLPTAVVWGLNTTNVLFPFYTTNTK